MNKQNRFFYPLDGVEQPRSGRVYAAFEIEEVAEEHHKLSRQLGSFPDEPVHLECIESDWFDAYSTGKNGYIDFYLNAPLQVIELTDRSLPPGFQQGRQPGEIVWFYIDYEIPVSTLPDAVLYTSLFSEGTPISIRRFESISMTEKFKGKTGKARILPSIPDTSPEIFDSALLSVLLSIEDTEIEATVAYDVGQGSCQAILANPFHPHPILYIDFGGGILGNKKTYPESATGYCFSSNPAIVLSHWDWDHWSSAHRFPTSLKATWIAPPVPEKPVQRAFAATLADAGVLFQWPLSQEEPIRLGNIRLEKCGGRTTNDSGIAVTAYAGSGAQKTCLFPGDADYRYIPSVMNNEIFDALVVSHHGGRLKSSEIPKASNTAYAICSTGAGNSYSHPYIDTFTAHQKNGWPSALITGAAHPRPSHVILDWKNSPRHIQGICHKDGEETERCSTAFLAER